MPFLPFRNPCPNPLLVFACLMLCLVSARASAQSLTVQQTQTTYEFSVRHFPYTNEYGVYLENNHGESWFLRYTGGNLYTWSFSKNISELRPGKYWLRFPDTLSHFVTLPVPQYDVGVIADGNTCPDDSNTRVQYFMDNEDYDPKSAVTGWTGSITLADTHRNTRFVFCRVDGLRFRNVATSSGDIHNYAVLKLGQQCPPDSKEFTRHFDNQDGENRNVVEYGNFSPNAFVGLATSGWTDLRFCLFNSSPDAPLMSGFPSLGFNYGVFASSSHRYALRTGDVYTDDEDGSRDNNNWYSADGAWKADAVRIITEGENTHLYTAQVRRELVNGVATAPFSGATNERQYWTIEVPAGVTRVTFTLSGSSGDADLYVLAGGRPDLVNFNCRPYSGGSNEVCEMNTPWAGTWYVMVNGYSAYSNVTLKAHLMGNLAIDAVASASSTYCPSTTNPSNCYSPSRINDGSTSTALGGQYSWSNAIAPLPQWVELDFGGWRTFARAELYTTADYPIQDYRLEAWNGSAWVTLADVQGNTLAQRSHVFSRTTASKLRVFGLKGPSWQVGHIRLNELEVYTD